MFAAGAALAALLAGLLWHLLATPPTYTIGDDKGAIISEQSLAQSVAMDIWYVLISVVMALGLGAYTWGLLRRIGWPLVIFAVVGAVLAGWVAWQFGHLLGPRDFAERLGSASPGDHVPMDLDLHSAWLIMVWPLAVSVPILLAALWATLRGRDR